ncbi:flavodoxin domain-containing protein [Geodermatophilus sp. SYSU D00698]
MSRPRVLVAHASRHGSTREIAEALARDVGGSPAGRSVGLSAAAPPAGSRPDPAAWDAVVPGSAVHAGRRLPPAQDLAVRCAGVLRRRPVWLFSSGPIGDPPYPPEDPQDAAAPAALLAPRGHRVLPGRLDPGPARLRRACGGHRDACPGRRRPGPGRRPVVGR